MKPPTVRDVEASVLDDLSLDNLSQQERSGIAFVALNVKQLLEVVVAIGYAAGIDIEIKCRGQLDGMTVMLIRTASRSSDPATSPHGEPS